MNSGKHSVISPGSWLSIFGIFLTGVLASISVAKLIPLGQDFYNVFNTGPADFGFLISVIGIPAALLALPSGIVVDRYGPKAVLLGCAVVGVITNVIYLFGPTLLVFHLARIVEGAVVCFTYTAGPAYLMSATEGKRRGTAMTIWSMYTPVGVTSGLFLGGLFAGTEHWRHVFSIQGVLYVVAGLLVLMQGAVTTARPGEIMGLLQRLREVGKAYLQPSILLLALATLVAISLGFGANSTFPSYFAALHDISMSSASNLVASVTMVMALGSLLTAVLMGRGFKPHTLFIAYSVAGMLFGSLSFYPEISLVQRPFVVAGWFLASGASMACVMALMPLVAEPHQRASAAALINQAGALATFVTPPLWLSMAAGGHWLPFAVMICGGSALIILFVWVIALRTRVKE